MPPHSPNSPRDLFPGHGAGKGDAERSPNWRSLFPDSIHTGVKGLVKIKEGRYRKVYRTSAASQGPVEYHTLAEAEPFPVLMPPSEKCNHTGSDIYTHLDGTHECLVCGARTCLPTEA